METPYREFEAKINKIGEKSSLGFFEKDVRAGQREKSAPEILF